MATSPWRIPLIRPTIGGQELEAVKRVFESGMLTQGEVTRQFEKEFAQYLGVKHAVATSSGTTALHLALLCCGVKRGDEVIVPDFTFPATGNVVFHCGAKPVLCDIRLNEFQIEPDCIEPLITDKTKVIIPVSEFGLTADMKPITEIAEKHGLNVVEDACPGLGSKRYGKYAGTFGDFGCFSFHPRKLLAVGEGGMLVTDNNDYAALARSLRDHGRASHWEFDFAGYNYRLSDVQSAIGRVQLKKMPQKIRQRRALAETYNDHLKNHYKVPYVPPRCYHTYQSYVILLDEPSDHMRNKLRTDGIEVQIGTNCLHVLKPYQKSRRNICENAYTAWKNSLTLPLFDGMTADEQRQVIEGLKS